MKFRYLISILLFFLFPLHILPNENKSAPDSCGRDARSIEGLWLFKTADDSNYSNPEIVTEGWDETGINFSWPETQKYSDYKGNAWFRKTILVQDIAEYALSVPIHYRGAQFYWNGTLIRETRPFSPSGETPAIIGKPSFFPIPEHLIHKCTNVISVRTGYLNHGGGFYGDIKIGEYQSILQNFISTCVKDTSLGAINIFLSLFFFLLYRKRKKDLYYLYYSLLSLSAGLFIFGFKGIVLHVLDYQNVYLLATYTSGIIFAPLLILFLESFLKIRGNLFSRTLIILFSMTLFLFLIDLIVNGNIEAFSDHIYMPYICLTGVGFLYALMLSIKGKIRKAPYSNFILSGVLGFSLIYLTTGFLWYLTVSDIPDLTAEGFFFMTVVFAAALTTRFAQVHTDLEKAHGDLLVLDRMKDDFMATTSHELRTPLHASSAWCSRFSRPRPEGSFHPKKYDVE